MTATRTTPVSRALPDLTGRTAVVTGATSGIGTAVTTALAAHGARVVLAVRDTAKGERVAAATPGITEVRPLDLADLSSVRAFTEGWDGPIDLLVNNAGVIAHHLRHTRDGFELQFGTNHLGPFALTTGLLPHLSGRVVTLASQAERGARLDLENLEWRGVAYKSSRAYANSKLANLLFTAELQRRLAASGSTVQAHAAHPGFVATGMSAESGLVMRLAVRLLAQDAAAGADPVLYAATADIPADSFTGPERFAHMRGGAQLINRSATARDTDLAARLWTISEELTHARSGIRWT